MKTLVWICTVCKDLFVNSLCSIFLTFSFSDCNNNKIGQFLELNLLLLFIIHALMDLLEKVKKNSDDKKKRKLYNKKCHKHVTNAPKGIGLA